MLVGNQKERSLVLLAGNGAIVLQIWTVASRWIESADRDLAALFAPLAGVGIAALIGVWFAYRALGQAYETPAAKTRAERHLFISFALFASNVALGVRGAGRNWNRCFNSAFDDAFRSHKLVWAADDDYRPISAAN